MAGKSYFKFANTGYLNIRPLIKFCTLNAIDDYAWVSMVFCAIGTGGSLHGTIAFNNFSSSNVSVSKNIEGNPETLNLFKHVHDGVIDIYVKINSIGWIGFVPLHSFRSTLLCIEVDSLPSNAVEI